MNRIVVSAMLVGLGVVFSSVSAQALPFYDFYVTTDYEGGNVQYDSGSGSSPVSGSVTGAPIGSGFADASAAFYSATASTGAFDIVTADAYASFSDTLFYGPSGTVLVNFGYSVAATDGPDLGNVPDAFVGASIFSGALSDYDEVLVESSSDGGILALEISGDISAGVGIYLEAFSGGPNGTAFSSIYVDSIYVDGELVYEVPEPAALLLLGAGLFGLLAAGRFTSRR